MLDIYIVRNWNLEDVSGGGWTLLQLLCGFGRDGESIKRMTNVYIERNYDLGRVTKDNYNALHFACRYCDMNTIKYMIDIFLDEKMVSEKRIFKTYENLLNSNLNLNIGGKKCIWAYLNSIEVKVFI